jgi:DNA-binding IclR family transcriptional regulator
MASSAPRQAAKFEGAETARRALRLLEVVVTARQPVSLTELGEATGLSKSTCYRLARVLQEELYLERLESGGYWIGSRLVGLSAAVLSEATLYTAALPTLRALANAAGETVTAHVRSGARTVLILGAESATQALRRAAMIGETNSLLRGCSGQSILAFLPESESEPLIATAEDPSTLREQLAQVRADGYALSFGANHPGLHGIAAPVLATFDARAGGNGSAAVGELSPPLSVSVSGPAERWTEAKMRAFADQLVAACEQLSTLLSTPASRRS